MLEAFSIRGIRYHRHSYMYSLSEVFTGIQCQRYSMSEVFNVNVFNVKRFNTRDIQYNRDSMSKIFNVREIQCHRYSCFERFNIREI